MPDSIPIWRLLLLVNLPVYLVWGWILFRSWGDFRDAIVFWFKPKL